MNIYRKIYETFYGKIPVDQDGRSYEIHHIDGNNKNNHIFNLVAISIQDHYDVHYIQGDYGACWFIARKMKKTPKQISELAKLTNKQRLLNGSHPFLNVNHVKETQNKLVKSGKHRFCSSEWQKQNQQSRVKKGTHPWLNKDYHSNLNYSMLKSGKHPSQNKVTCCNCQKTMSRANFIRWNHGENCTNLK